MKRILICLLCLLTAALAACGGESAPAASPAPTLASEPAPVPSPEPASLPRPVSTPVPTSMPDCAEWLAVTGGEALWGTGEPAPALGEEGLGYVDLQSKDCWLRTAEGWADCGNLESAGFCLVCLEGPDAEIARILVTEKGALPEEPRAEEIPGRHFEGWFTDAGSPWRFADTPLLNNGGSFDYRVHVDAYDPETYSAIVTVTRLG